MKKRYRTVNDYYREIFGEKIFKLPIDAGFDCPNRDGTVAHGGCTFCTVSGSGDAIVAPESGTILWEIGGDGECVKAIEPFIGKEYNEGDRFCYLENTHGQITELPAALGGKLVEINAKQGARVNKGDVIAYIQRGE